jgi:opacity protein-like surface antigen
MDGKGGKSHMTRLMRVFAVVGVVAVLGTGSAVAQGDNSGSGTSLGGFGGVSIPLGDYSDVTNTGWDAGLVFQYKLMSSAIGFQIDGNYMENNFDASGGLPAGKDRWFFATGNVAFHFPVSAETTIRPYLIGGFGIYTVKAKFDDGTSGESTTKFGLNLGAGFDLKLQGSVSVFVEARFHDVFVEGSNAKFVPINAGIRFHAK